MNSKTALDLAEEIGKRESGMIELRRDFHRHAELSSQEHLILVDMTILSIIGLKM